MSTGCSIDVWRDDTALADHPMAWRSQCSCRGVPSDAQWRPAWAASTYEDAAALGMWHLRTPRPDDFMRNPNDFRGGGRA